MIGDVLARASLARTDVRTVAVGIGPGSYTGIRIAIAAAQGWALAHHIPLVGIDSVEATAHQAHHLGIRGPAAVIADAHRHEVYVAEYLLGPDAVTPLSALRIVGRGDLEALRAAGRRIVGPDLEQLGIPGDLVFPEAGTVASLALSHPVPVPPEELRPIYLRATTFVKAPPPRFPRETA